MKKPNFLFFLADQHRGDWMPYQENIFEKLRMNPLPLNMLNIKHLMTHGVTFTRAITSSPLCAPARASLASGLRYDKCGVVDNKVNYPLKKRTFYSVLKQNGYQVGGVGKFDLNKANSNWSDEWYKDLKKIGFTDSIDNAGKWDAVNSYLSAGTPKDPYMNYLEQRNLALLHIEDMENRRDLLNTAPTPLPEEAYCDNWLSQNGIKMLKRFKTDQPWFLQVNFAGPHSPWDITKGMKKIWKNVRVPPPKKWDKSKLINDVIKVRQNYAAMLDNIDRNIGLFIDELEHRDELDNTIIIYSSDHGEMLGDFNKWKKRKPERASTSIPLVIKGPEVQQGYYSESLVELQDLAATIVDYADSKMPEAFDSISLKPVLEGNKSKHREYQVSGLKEWRLICSNNFKLIQETNNFRLYNLHSDPWETKNILEDKKSTYYKLFNILKKELPFSL